MPVARLLYVGSVLPYCPLAAPYGFDMGQGESESGLPIVTPEGPGSVFPLRLSLSEYAYYFWRVKGYTLSGDISVAYTRVDPITEEAQTWSGSSTFEIDYERTVDEHNLICASNTQDESLFQLGENAHTFTGTYETGETSEEAQFALTLRFGAFITQDEVSWNAVGLSQTESGKLAAFVGIVGGLTASVEGGASFEIQLRSGRTVVQTPGADPIEGEPIANIEFLLPGEEEAPVGRSVAIYPFVFEGQEGAIEGVTFENLRFAPSKFYEYALNARPALYDPETGEVIGDF
jgi:hypothetical protein